MQLYIEQLNINLRKLLQSEKNHYLRTQVILLQPMTFHLASSWDVGVSGSEPLDYMLY